MLPTSEQPRSLADRFLRPILASRFLTISALLHLLLVVLLGGKVLVNKYVEPPDFQSTGDFVDSGDNSPPPPAAAPADTLPPEPSASTAPPPPSAPAAAMTAITSMSTTMTSFSMEAPTLTPPTISNELPQPAAQAQQPSGNTGLPSLPGSMSGRGDKGRGKLGQTYGEKSTSEQAVLKALRWLQTQQHTDGTWGGRYKGAMTGLALLCYLGHGETPDTSREFGVVVTNAINSLVSEGQGNQGRFSFSKEGFNDNESVYQHAICTYALCEAYTMTKNDKLPPLITQAIGYILKGQLPSGGWVYKYEGGSGPKDLDSSVTGWQVQALKAAHLTGLAGMGDIHNALDRAVKGLDTLFNPKDGSYGYHKIGDRNYTVTGVGVLCKLFWQGRADRMVMEALKNIKSQDLDYNGKSATLYTWYYDTQACFQAQGGAWEWWNHRFQDQLVNRQNAEGSWPRAGGNETTSNMGEDDASVYRTTLCTLMLEVFYRYLPTTKENSMGGGGVQGL